MGNRNLTKTRISWKESYCTEPYSMTLTGLIHYFENDHFIVEVIDASYDKEHRVGTFNKIHYSKAKIS